MLKKLIVALMLIYSGDGLSLKPPESNVKIEATPMLESRLSNNFKYKCPDYSERIEPFKNFINTIFYIPKIPETPSTTVYFRTSGYQSFVKLDLNDERFQSLLAVKPKLDSREDVERLAKLISLKVWYANSWAYDESRVQDKNMEHWLDPYKESRIRDLMDMSEAGETVCAEKAILETIALGFLLSDTPDVEVFLSQSLTLGQLHSSAALIFPSFRDTVIVTWGNTYNVKNKLWYDSGTPWLLTTNFYNNMGTKDLKDKLQQPIAKSKEQIK